jgi:diacyltrehalose acyltransferase
MVADPSCARPTDSRRWIRRRDGSMNRVTKGLGVFAALLSSVAVPNAGAAAPVAGPATVLVGQKLPSPAAVVIVDPINGLVQQLTGFPPPQPEFLCVSPNTCTNLIYPFLSIPEGVTTLGTTISSTSGPIIVFAYSQGAQVAEQWLKQNANSPNAPNANNLVFVLTGNATRAYGGSLVEPAGGVDSLSAEVWPQSQYQVVDIARQYEYSADYPNNPLSPFYGLAIVNAVLGGYYLHDYTSVDNLSAINDPANTVWKVGNITYVLIPTQTLPLLDPLQQMGLTSLAGQLNGMLKPLVDSAYNRNYPGLVQPGVAAAQPASVPITLAAASRLPSPVVSDPTVSPQNTTVSVSLAPAPSEPAVSAPTSIGPDNATGDPKGGPVTDTATTTTPSDPADVRALADTPVTTPPSDSADVLNAVLNAVKKNTPRAALPGLNNSIASIATKQSTTAPTTRTIATSHH